MEGEQALLGINGQPTLGPGPAVRRSAERTMPTHIGAWHNCANWWRWSAPVARDGRLLCARAAHREPVPGPWRATTKRRSSRPSLLGRSSTRWAIPTYPTDANLSVLDGGMGSEYEAIAVTGLTLQVTMPAWPGSSNLFAHLKSPAFEPDWLELRMHTVTVRATEACWDLIRRVGLAARPEEDWNFLSHTVTRGQQRGGNDADDRITRARPRRRSRSHSECPLPPSHNASISTYSWSHGARCVGHASDRLLRMLNERTQRLQFGAPGTYQFAVTGSLLHQLPIATAGAPG